MPDPRRPFVIRKYPFAMWLFGLFLSGTGYHMVFGNQGTVLLGMLLVGVGLLILLWESPILTITVDKSAGILTIVAQYVLRRTYKEYKIRDIAGVEVENRESLGSHGDPTTVYGVQLLLANGQRDSLSPLYSGVRADNEYTAQKLRNALGILDAESAHARALDASQASLPDFRPNGLPQEAGAAWPAELPAAPQGEPAYQTTAGVSWRMVADERNPAQFGGLELQRWFSPDFKFANGFLYLVQKPKGSPAFGTGGLLGGVSKTLYQVSLRLFGFDEEHTPGFDQAELLQPLEPRLEKDYLALTTDSDAARQVLNPWTTLPLAQWAERYPVKQVQNRADGGQLAVLFSPLGVYVACIGPNPAQRAALTDLGFELVKAQGV